MTIGTFNLTEPLATKDSFIVPSIPEVQKVDAIFKLQIVVEYCALPLGISFTEEGPKPKYPKVGSILLHGSSGTGKTRLIKTLATEIGAILFNLSPKNTEGEFPTKQDVTKMIHTVFKVAKANSPAIIVIDGIEMIFAKKVYF